MANRIFAIVLLLAAAAAVAEAPHRYTCESIPLLQKPFDGEYPFSNAFDHYVGGTNGRQLSAWGAELYGVSGHLGWDWPMKLGTPLLAASDGEVVGAGDRGATRCPPPVLHADHDRFVKIRVQAPDGRYFAYSYLHLSEVDVHPGDHVRAGQRIGLSGDSGCATGPHLHFFTQLLLGNRDEKPWAVDPFGWDASTEDPRAASFGRPSFFLWKDGQAPLLYRQTAGLGQKGPPSPAIITLVRSIGWKDAEYPNGEFVEVSATGGDVDVSGWKLKNLAGSLYTFPAGSVIRPREPVRVFTGSGQDNPRTRFWNQAHGMYDDRKECVRLVDASGAERTAHPAGRADEHPCQ